MCADTEQELNKWVTGIRVAKYGKQLFTNYRGIVEEMAHDDLDQLASSRFSADPITLAVAAAQVNNFFIVMSLEKRRVFIHSFMTKIICYKSIYCIGLGTIHILRQLIFVFFDQLASSRFSADPITLAVVAEQVKNFMIVIKGHYVKYHSFFFSQKNC